MGIQQGLTGLAAVTKHMDVIGNNLANAGTVGFKSSSVQFSDIMAGAGDGGDEDKIGVGTQMATISSNFAKGNISTTNNPLDVAINGLGFFRMESKDGAIGFSRNGQFQLDKEDFIVNSAGLYLTGYKADAEGNLNGAVPEPLTISKAAIAPKPTSSVQMSLGLRGDAQVPSVTPFSRDDLQSYNDSTSVTLHDGLGKEHVASLYFVRTATPGEWNIHGTLDGTAADLGAGDGQPVVIQFNGSGVLTTTTPFTANFAMPDAVQQAVTFDLANSVQFGSIFGVNTLSQDGYPSGSLTGSSIGADGIIKGRYSNGQTKVLGQMVLANFPNVQGLRAIGGNQWEETPLSNKPVIGVPGDGSLGALQAGAVEDSNVDVTSELVNMIALQRAYQANAQLIKAQDALSQSLVNLR